jgi:hypothetical protein
MSNRPSPPRPSRTVPSDVSLPKLPAEFEKTPSHFPVTAAYVQRKLAERDNGKPVFSPKLAPWFFAGFTLFSAVLTAVVGDPTVPLWIVKVAAIGATTFGGLLAATPGFRKGMPR